MRTFTLAALTALCQALDVQTLSQSQNQLDESPIDFGSLPDQDLFFAQVAATGCGCGCDHDDDDHTESGRVEREIESEHVVFTDEFGNTTT